jgi:hypothetical protein
VPPTAITQNYLGVSMIDEDSSDTNSNEGPIARARRKTRELGEESLALAEREAEQFIQCLGREPTGAERILIEHITILDLRTRKLRAWGRHTEADATTQILMKALGELHKIRPRS